MRNKSIAAVVAVVVVVVVLVAVLHQRQKIQRSSTPVHIASPSGASNPAGTSTPAGSKAHKVNGVFTGPAVEMEYGPVQVALDVRAGEIVDVKAVQYPVDRPRSQFINAQAVPLLRSEVLQAQSANINIISGATFTSEAFANSLQAAIGQEQQKAAAQH